MSKINLPSTDLEKSSPAQISKQKVVVCRGRSCKKYQAEQVWQEFEQNLPPQIELMSVPCLGQCGNGAMVVIEPEQTWYSQVHPNEVTAVIQQHLIDGSPVRAMLYPKFHS